MRSIHRLLALALAAAVVPACGGGGGGAGGSSTPALGQLLTLAESKSYFPAAIGSRWALNGTDVGGTNPGNCVLLETISGTASILDASTLVFTDTNTTNPGSPIDTYRTTGDAGIMNYGNNDPSDFLTPQLVPYPEVEFPLQVGVSFQAFSKTNLVWAQDLDGDGLFEKANADCTVKVAAIEPVSVLAGSFSNCVRIETTLTITIIFSSDHSTATLVEVDVEWFAPGVGPVKRTATTTGGGSTDTDTEILATAGFPAPYSLPPTTLPGGVGPNAVLMADVNGDGKLDLIVTNGGTPSLMNSDSSVSVHLGDGSGGFGATIPCMAGTLPVAIAVGDFNGDGKPDLAIANYGGTSVSILLGNGDGTFGAPTNLPVTASTNPTGVVVGDFNGDGKLDLAVSVAFGGNATPGHVSVFLGNGDGTFGGSTDFTVGGAPGALVAADFNHDGKLDLAVSNSLSASISILLGDGAGSFSVVSDISLPGAPGALVVGDLNGDGVPDLAVAINASLINNSGVAILLGTGTGTFGPSVSFPLDTISGSTVGGLAVADFDGDGFLDLAVGKHGGGPPGGYGSEITLLHGDGTGSFSPIVTFIPGLFAGSLAVGDLNGDAEPDLVTVDGTSVSVILHIAP